jgi:hypothetical protein
MILHNTSMIGQASPSLHFHFQIQIIARRAQKSREIRTADERCIFAIPCKLACEGI